MAATESTRPPLEHPKLGALTTQYCDVQKPPLDLAHEPSNGGYRSCARHQVLANFHTSMLVESRTTKSNQASLELGALHLCFVAQAPIGAQNICTLTANLPCPFEGHFPFTLRQRHMQACFCPRASQPSPSIVCISSSRTFLRAQRLFCDKPVLSQSNCTVVEAIRWRQAPQLRLKT